MRFKEKIWTWSSLTECRFFDDPARLFPGGSTAFAQEVFVPNSAPNSNSFETFGVESAQSNIVNSRSDQVCQHFGQITPPYEHAPKSSRLQSSKTLVGGQQQEHTSRLSKEQRARSAANHRHHKSKESKKDEDLVYVSGDGNSNLKSSKSITVQREKNRLAAAKCRAKKKAENEVKEKEARQKAAENNQLTRQARELRDERSRLRSLILAHNPRVCGCQEIHQFNIREAQKLVLGAGNHFPHSMSSPSEDSISPVPSPGSDASLQRVIIRIDQRLKHEHRLETSII